MITWNIYNTMGSRHKTYSSVSSWLQPKWPFTPPWDTNSMRVSCQLHHLLPVPHLLMLTKRALVGSTHGFPEHIPGLTDVVGGCPPPVPINLLLSLTHSHIFLLIFFCPLESLVLIFLFFLQPLLLKGLEGFVMVGLKHGSKREKDRLTWFKQDLNFLLLSARSKQSLCAHRISEKYLRNNWSQESHMPVPWDSSFTLRSFLCYLPTADINQQNKHWTGVFQSIFFSLISFCCPSFGVCD